MNTIFWPKDKNGNLKSLSSWNKVENRYKKIIEDVKEVYLANINNDNIVSIYIIGSITTGNAKYGISDIDSFVLVKNEQVDNNWIKEESEIISQNYKCVSKVGLKVVPIEEVLKQKDVFKAFLIKTQGLCIYGEDLNYKLPKFKPDREIALPKITKFSKYIKEAREAILVEDDVDKIKLLCRKYNKVLIRTAGLLVIEKTHEYSNDVNTCLSLFLKYYPEFENDLTYSLDLVENPISDKEIIITHLEKMKDKFSPIIDRF